MDWTGYVYSICFLWQTFNCILYRSNYCLHTYSWPSSRLVAGKQSHAARSRTHAAHPAPAGAPRPHSHHTQCRSRRRQQPRRHMFHHHISSSTINMCPFSMHERQLVTSTVVCTARTTSNMPTPLIQCVPMPACDCRAAYQVGSASQVGAVRV